MRWVLTVAMVLVGVSHFTHADMFVSIMPPYLPWHLELVYLSGVIEIGLGLGLAVPALRNLSAWGLIALFVAVYPANIHMALAGVQPAGMPDAPGWVAWARLPFQFLFIYWAYRYTDRSAASRGAPGVGQVAELS